MLKYFVNDAAVNGDDDNILRGYSTRYMSVRSESTLPALPGSGAARTVWGSVQRCTEAGARRTKEPGHSAGSAETSRHHKRQGNNFLVPWRSGTPFIHVARRSFPLSFLFTCNLKPDFVSLALMQHWYKYIIGSLMISLHHVQVSEMTCSIHFSAFYLSVLLWAAINI